MKHFKEGVKMDSYDETEEFQDNQKDQHGQIHIYSVSPFENSYSDTIRFKNQEEQLKFFETSDLLNEIYKNDSYSQMERSGAIVVEGDLSHYEKVSYMRFKNGDSGVWYFAHILFCDYENIEATTIYFEIDPFQTHQFELFSHAIFGNVEQATLPNKNGGFYNVINSRQGFTVGSMIPQAQHRMKHEIQWLIAVLKTSAKLGDNDKRVNSVSFPATVKGFRYFVCPVDISTGQTLEFSYKGTTVKKNSIDRLVKELTSKFDDEQNTANQAVNIFTQKHIGLDYEVDKGKKVIIKETNFNGKIFSFGQELNQGDSGTTIPPSGNANINWTGTLKNGNVELSEANCRAIIQYCRQYKILPSVAISQMWLESFWGTSSVGQADNNWGGITYPGTGNPSVSVTQGTARGVGGSEGGFYCRYNSPTDYFNDYCYLLRDGGWYKVSGQGDFDKAISGLFISGGAVANYAASYEHYQPLMREIWNDIQNANGNRATEFLNQVYNNGWVSTSPSAGNKGIERLNELVGQLWGNGQCYAVPAEYSGILGGCGLGAGTSYGFSDIIGDTYNACNIGSGYDWAKKGWLVINRPSSADQAQVGDIINWASFGGSGLGSAGHTGVIIGKSGNTLNTIEQNAPVGSPITKHDRDFNLWQIESLVRPPLSITGGTGGTPPSSDTTSSSSTSSLPSLIEVIRAYRGTTKEIEMDFNITNQMKKYINNYLGLGDIAVESQLLNSEFTQCKLYDGFGNSYIYQIEEMPQLTNDNNTFILNGAIGDSNHIHATIKEYRKFVTDSSIPYETFNHGIMDSTPRDLTIQVDNTATFMQQNKNSYQAQQQSFKENKGLLDKQISLNDDKLANTINQSTFNANFAVTKTAIGGAESVFDSVMGMASTPSTAFNSPLMGVGMVGKGAFLGANIGADMGNALAQKKFTAENNAMNSQQNSLSNMQAKTSMNQSIRAYNASIKDISNQPISLQQVGADLSFQDSLRLDEYIFEFSLPQKFILQQANNFIKAFGVTLNLLSFDVERDYLRNRKYFNYIKLSNFTVKQLNMNQSHFNSLRSIFITGVRIWNYDAEDKQFNSRYLNTSIPNPDN